MPRDTITIVKIETEVYDNSVKLVIVLDVPGDSTADAIGWFVGLLENE